MLPEHTADDLATMVQCLGDFGQHTGSAVGPIKNMAAQTNLPALNTAIAAARAGEHGRGLAVVSDEFRKLVGESARGAQGIIGMVTQIRQATERAMAAMVKGQNQAKEAVA
ncbi:MAG: hypothetical protein H7338_04800 [Candidatus Sericytochromatia bacterium]|nr:hypothetical protein [Candidatus Sericytochromatia bacterium]